MATCCRGHPIGIDLQKSHHTRVVGLLESNANAPEIALGRVFRRRKLTIKYCHMAAEVLRKDTIRPEGVLRPVPKGQQDLAGGFSRRNGNTPPTSPERAAEPVHRGARGEWREDKPEWASESSHGRRPVDSAEHWVEPAVRRAIEPTCAARRNVRFNRPLRAPSRFAPSSTGLRPWLDRLQRFGSLGHVGANLVFALIRGEGPDEGGRTRGSPLPAVLSRIAEAYPVSNARDSAG